MMGKYNTFIGCNAGAIGCPPNFSSNIVPDNQVFSAKCGKILTALIISRKLGFMHMA
jgi:hypothetical protein